MRRSKAPSMVNRAKRLCNISNAVETETHGSEPEDEDYKWGSRSNAQYSEITSNRRVNKRIFNVVWRDISTKKHKTWKGDGTLEVNELASSAILKDETGKYMGCSKKFDRSELGPDFQMIVGNKEIEIQGEINDDEELLQLRRKQVENRHWGEEEWMSPEDIKEEQKKPKGGFKFKPLLILKSPQTPAYNENLSVGDVSTNWEKPISFTKIQSTAPDSGDKSHKHLFCFVRPSDLQQFLFENVLEYYNSVKFSLTWENIKNLDILQILQHICNHPSFINYKSSENDLIQHLLPKLPDWSEMGPFDSGKLEFVQLCLSEIIKENGKNYIILAKNTNSINMLQGLCDFMHIKCLRLNTNFTEDQNIKIFNEFSTNLNNKLTQVLIVNCLELVQYFEKLNIMPQKLIIFEDILPNMRIVNNLKHFQNCMIYYLVTAFSIEELLLNNTINADTKNLLETLQELFNFQKLDDTCCYLHTKIRCKCLQSASSKEDNSIPNPSHMFLTNWKHITYPFKEDFLKVGATYYV